MDTDIRALRILLKVIETNSFSGAARALRLTQPTVSQQIARLEAQLGGRLFERVGHEIYLTALGRKFRDYALEIVERSDRFVEDLSQDRVRHAGSVRYVMPESCQWTPHFRKIMAQIQEFPEIVFEIGILPSEAVIQAILEGKAEFGFAVGERLQPEIQFEHFADEAYAAIASRRKLLDPIKAKHFKDIRWIAFPGWELFFDTWSKSQGISKAVKASISNPVVKIGTLAGAIHAVQEGAGVAILPRQCVADELARGILQEQQLSSKHASNPVHIVRRRGDRLSARAEVILGMLREAKRSS